MPSLRPAALLFATLACTRPESSPHPPAAIEHDPTPAKPLRVAPPTGHSANVLAQAGLESSDPETKCRDSYQLARCLQARANPGVKVFWTLYWDTLATDERGNGFTYSETELLARRQRVVDRLKADGATNILDHDASSVWVIAPHPAVRGAMAMPEVQHVEVHCDDADTEFCACARLRVDQCQQHAFCQSLYGQRRDERRACMQPRELAGCTRAEACNDSTMHMTDPGGEVWLLPNTCKPEQPGWRHVQHRLEPLPDCPTPRG